MPFRARPAVLLPLVLLAVCLILMARHPRPARTEAGPAASGRTEAKPPPASAAIPQPSAIPGGNDPRISKPIRIGAAGKVRLKPGETAVLSYWEMAPGMNGMALVTPEKMPNGSIKMSARLLQLSDKAVEQASAKDMFPDLFEMERCGALGSERLGRFLEAIQDAGGADMLLSPTLVTMPGMKAAISVGRSNADQLSLGLQADLLDEDGGFDLAMDLNRRESAR